MLLRSNSDKSSRVKFNSYEQQPPLSSPIQNFQDHFVENFNISQRAPEQVFPFFIWSQPFVKIDVRYKTEKFWDKKILQPKMQT